MTPFISLYAAVQARLASHERHERGATATEYAVLVAVIALILILGASFFGSQLESLFSKFGSVVGKWTAAIT